MGGQKFQYDESGVKFFYFLLTFLFALLVPASYYLWPQNEKIDHEKLKQECRCDPCKTKKNTLKSKKPRQRMKNNILKIGLIACWIILLFFAYKLSQLNYDFDDIDSDDDYANFDPFEILQVSPSATEAEIKKSYRDKSKIYHPDKETGDEKTFMMLNKAYQALTDEEARENWEKYGNPDGPRAMKLGIALPSWIVETQKSVWVLCAYALIFMIILPTVVCTWWYKSIRYTGAGQQVLLQTTQLYSYFFAREPFMPLKRVLMILSSSHEFHKNFNNEIQERASDNIEIPQLMKKIPNLGERNKERPFCFLYSIKARALLFAHLSRMPLPAETLHKDRMYIVKKCPTLLQEMITISAYFHIRRQIDKANEDGKSQKKSKKQLNNKRRDKKSDKKQSLIQDTDITSIETIENLMKLCPMIVQGLWQFQSPLLQLPHIYEENLKWFNSKKRHIKSLQQFAQLDSDERRTILRSLTDEQYEDVMKVLGRMPYVQLEVKSEVIDDEEPTVYTAGAVVTVTVMLERKNMEVLFGDQHTPDKTQSDQNEEDEEDKEKKEDVKKPPAWLKQKKGKKGGKKNSKKPSKSVSVNSNDIGNKKSTEQQPNTEIEKKLSKEETEENASESQSEDGSESDDEQSDEQVKETTNIVDEDDEEDWEKFHKPIPGREKFKAQSRKSHTVHCPFFPDDKQEYWWVYICDKKNKKLHSTTYQVTSLVEMEEVQLQFIAPKKAGFYTFTVCLRSDSYSGFDQMQDIKLDIKEARDDAVDHPQWKFDEENNKEDEEIHDSGVSDESDVITDDDVE